MHGTFLRALLAPGAHADTVSRWSSVELADGLAAEIHRVHVRRVGLWHKQSVIVADVLGELLLSIEFVFDVIFIFEESVVQGLAVVIECVVELIRLDELGGVCNFGCFFDVIIASKAISIQHVLPD